MKKQKYHFIKFVVLQILIICLFFTTAEVIQRFRYYRRFQSPYWLFYGFTAMPGDYATMHEKGLLRKQAGPEIIEVRTLYCDGYRKYNPSYKLPDYMINSCGFRGKEFNVTKNKDTYRIVALGGSTTFGLGAKDGFTYPELLEKILNSNSGKTYEVINAGICANTINEISNLFQKEILKLKPDLIIVNSLFNDLYYSKNTMSHRNNPLQKINWFLLRKSLFYMTMREKMAYMLNKPVGDIYKSSLNSMIDSFLKDASFWQYLKINFGEIIQTAKNNNIKIVIIKQPSWLRDYKNDKCTMLLDKKFLPVYNKAHILIDAIADENGAKVIDAFSQFDSLRDKEDYFTDGLHLTKKGNSYLASIVAKSVALP